MITNKTRDHHLNIFRSYRDPDVVENNLTRALAMCLQQDALFFTSFFQLISSNPKLSNHHLNDLLHYVDGDEQIQIDIQVDVINLADESVEHVFGITLTTEKIPEKDFELEPEDPGNGRQITDLVIRLRNWLFIVEVKRSNEHCVAQLKKQLFGVKEKVKAYQSLSWEEVMNAMRKARNIYQLLGQQSTFLEDFRELIASQYADWLPTAPFRYIDLKNTDPQEFLEKVYKRLDVSKQYVTDYSFDFQANRSLIPVDWGWASEVIPYFENNEAGNTVLNVYIWPANTKTQGRKVYYRPGREAWQQKRKLQVEGHESFPLFIYPQIKFSNSYGKYISEFSFTKPEDLLEPIHTQENFEYSGKWTRTGEEQNWSQLEAFFDDHIAPEFDWRTKSKWQEKFIDSNRNIVFISFGFVVITSVPYDYLQQIDQQASGPKAVGNLLNNITQAYEHLLD